MNDSLEGYECNTCGTVLFGSDPVTCCGEPMAPVRDQESAIDAPTLETVLGAVFDISRTELEVCRSVMEAGETTAGELAEQTGYDRSMATRHLNHLAALGVVEKNRRLLERGGQIYVYTPVDEAAVRENLRREFLRWASEAADRITDLSREKVEILADAGPNDAERTVFHER